MFLSVRLARPHPELPPSPDSPAPDCEAIELEPVEPRLLMAAAVGVTTMTPSMTPTAAVVVTTPTTTSTSTGTTSTGTTPTSTTSTTTPTSTTTTTPTSTTTTGATSTTPSTTSTTATAVQPSLFVTPTNLVSDGGAPAAHTDADLVNPWGIAQAATSPFWVSDNGTGKATLYDAQGNKQSLVVTIPGAGGSTAAPTGQVANSGTGFVISANGQSGPARFIFVGEDGGITGWNPTVNATNAILAVDNSASGAVYKGATLATTTGGNTNLYVANFHSGKIEVYDSAFAPVSMGGSAFTDSQIPAGYAPFNIQNINGKLYVTYAKQDNDKHDDVHGAGDGFVDVFDPSGTLLQRFQHGFFLDSPWGLAKAPTSWGPVAGDILVGQFGSGLIDAFSPNTGAFMGFVPDQMGQPVQNDGLWALRFGNGKTSDADKLYFTAGLQNEADGLFGSLTFQPLSGTANPATTTSATGTTGTTGTTTPTTSTTAGTTGATGATGTTTPSTTMTGTSTTSGINTTSETTANAGTGGTGAGATSIM